MANPIPPLVTGAWIKDSAGSDLTLVNPMPVEQVGTVDVNIVGGGGAGGTASTDKGAFAAGVTLGTPAMGVVTPVDTPASGTLAVVALDANRNLKVNVVAGGAGGGAVTVADGADVTQGLKADPPATTATTDPWTVVSLLKGIFAKLLSGLGVTFTNTTIAVTQGTAANLNATVTGAVTANAGTNLNTSALALESGGNLAASKADLDTIAGAVSASKMAVSGTVTTTPPANASTNVAQIAGTTPDTNSGNKSAGTLRVVLATDQPQLTAKLLVTPDSVALPANQSVNVAQVAGTATSVNSGNKDAGTQRVVLATDQPAVPVSGTFYQATQPSSPVASTTGGATPYHYIAAAAANQDATVVKASAGQLYSIAGMCAVATPRFLKLYNKASAPTSSDTPVHTLMMPANGTTGAGFTLELPVGLTFSAGIAFRLTTGLADNDATACTAADCVINLGWI